VQVLRTLVIVIAVSGMLSCSHYSNCESRKTAVSDAGARVKLLEWADRCFSSFPQPEQSLIAGGLPGPGRRLISNGICLEFMPSEFVDLEIRPLGQVENPVGLFLGEGAYRGVLVARETVEKMMELSGDLLPNEIEPVSERIALLCRNR